MTALAKVTDRATLARVALVRRDAAIRAAVASGHSLRTVAAAAGLCHSGVRKIVARAKS